MTFLRLSSPFTKLGKLCIKFRAMSTSIEATPAVINQITEAKITEAKITEAKITEAKIDKTSKKKEYEKQVAEKKRKKAFFETFSARLPELSRPSYYKLECVNTVEEANTQLTKLLAADSGNVYGVDFEWPPCFTKGRPENKIALIQICTHKKILLIQVAKMKKLPEELLNFFKSKSLLKTGVNIRMDGLKLHRDFGVKTNGLVELMTMVESSKNPLLEKIHLRSLRALTAIFLKQKMNKGKVRISNWAAPVLNKKQKQYAALDAYASYKIYQKLTIEGVKSSDVEHLDEQLHNTPLVEKVVQSEIEVEAKKDVKDEVKLNKLKAEFRINAFARPSKNEGINQQQQS